MSKIKQEAVLSKEMHTVMGARCLFGSNDLIRTTKPDHRTTLFISRRKTAFLVCLPALGKRTVYPRLSWFMDFIGSASATTMTSISQTSCNDSCCMQKLPQARKIFQIREINPICTKVHWHTRAASRNGRKSRKSCPHFRRTTKLPSISKKAPPSSYFDQN